MSNSRMISPLSRKRLHSVVFLLMSIAFVPCIWNSQPSYGYCSDWSVGRGNSTSTATSDSKLPAKPEVLWEYKTDSDKSGFEGTPIIFDGKIFVGEMRGFFTCFSAPVGSRSMPERLCSLTTALCPGYKICANPRNIAKLKHWRAF